MTVGELMQRLRAMPKSRLIILQKDPEGNGYLPLGGIDQNCRWDAENSEVGLGKLTDAAKESGYSEEDVGNGKPCIVLFP